MAESGAMQAVAEERTADRVKTSRLWYAFLVGLLAWKLQLMINYALVPYSCWQGVLLLAHLASLTTVLMAVSGVMVGIGSWRALGRSYEMESSPKLGRARFMAIAGILFSAYFGMMIIAQWLPNLMLSPCDGIA